jgi:hypothetical protein
MKEIVPAGAVARDRQDVRSLSSVSAAELAHRIKEALNRSGVAPFRWTKC